MAEEDSQQRFRVNRRLLPVKGIYFLFFAAIGDLLPFIPIYMKQLGMTSTEFGIIYGVMPFVAFFVRPVFGAITDKTKKHKLVIMLCMVFTGLFYCLLLVVPGKQLGSTFSGGIQSRIQCGQMDSFLKDCEDIQNRSSDTTPQLQTCNIGLQQFSKDFNVSDKHVKCGGVCKLSMPLDVDAQVCFTNDVGAAMSDTCESIWKSLSSESEMSFEINDIGHILDNEIQDDVTQNGQRCNTYDLKNVSYNSQNYWQFVCNTDLTFNCVLSCGEEFHSTCVSVQSLTKTFWVFFVLFLFCNIFFSPVCSLIDAIAYDILGEKRGNWGRQRNWGTVGFIIFAVTSTFIMDSLSKSNQNINYSVSFYIFGALCVCSAFVTYFVKVSEALHSPQMFKNLRELIKYPEVVFFLIVVTCFGVLNSVIEAFLFWFLNDLGSSQITLGLCLVFNCIPEIIMLYFAGKIMNKIGEVPCLYIAAAAFAIRFFAYSFLTNAWYVLIVEPLHSFTFGLFYAAASGYGSKITPPGMSGTVQGLIGGLYFGFGKGIGSLITGKLIEPVSGLGSRWTFRVYGFFSLFLLLGYATIQTLFFRKKPDSQTKSPAAKDGQEIDAPAAEDMLLGTITINNENTEI